jgi:inositol hexakisphosphate/diphosphoinositol-pentakisphosphate kinase
MKMSTKCKKFLAFFKGKLKNVKIKHPRELQKILQIARENVHELIEGRRNDLDIEDERNKLSKYVQLVYVLEQDPFEGLNRKVQLRPISHEKVICPRTGEEKIVITEALFIFKFGGELTHSGMMQALELGENFRKKFYVDDPNAKGIAGGLLRLHNTYRHDLKCLASDEGRCLKTAAAFLKGLLSLEGALAPILATMVQDNEESAMLLDDSTRAQSQIREAQSALASFMHFDTDEKGKSLVEEFKSRFQEEPPKVIVEVLEKIGNPLKKMQRMFDLIHSIVDQLEHLMNPDNDETQNHDSYFIVPESFEEIFHKQRSMRRRSSSSECIPELQF